MTVKELAFKMRKYIGSSSDSKPTEAVNGTTPGSTFYEYDTVTTYITYDGTNWVVKRNPNGAGLVTKTSSSPLTTGSLFTYYGAVGIVSIVGTVTTIIEAAGTTTKLSYKPDALGEVDLCATLDINHFGVGSLLSITGTPADAMVGTTVVGGISPAQAGMPVLSCITSGVITVTYGHASTGAIKWDILWIPLNSSGLVVPA